MSQRLGFKPRGSQGRNSGVTLGRRIKIFALGPDMSYSSQVAEIMEAKIGDAQGSYNDRRTQAQRKEFIHTDIDLTITNADTISLLSGSNIGILPITNQLGGVVDGNMELIHKLLEQGEGLNILGWYNHRIRHVLACKQDAELSDIRTVHSHPQALKQCKTKIDENGLIINEVDSTTSYISDLEFGQAVVCNLEAARKNSLMILDDQFCPENNITNFVVLSSAQRQVLPGLQNLDTSRRVFTINIGAAGVSEDAIREILGRYSVDILFEKKEEFRGTSVLTGVLKLSITQNVFKRMIQELNSMHGNVQII